MDEVAEATGVPVRTLANIRASVSHRWLKDKYPKEYRELRAAKASKLTISQIKEVLKKLIDGITVPVLKKEYNISRGLVYFIRHKTKTYLINLYNNDSEARSLWNQLLGEKV